MAWSLGPADDYFVGFDNTGAAAELTARVIALGHRNVAMIAGVTSMNDRATDRVEGVRKALCLAGLDAAALPVVEAPYTYEDGSNAFDRVMEHSPRPTAVICGNDVLAVGAINRAKALGMRIPEDVSITGFDDIDIATFVEPALTTVHVPHRRMGVMAAQQLLRLIAGESTGTRIEIGTEIVERGSLGPPPG